MTFDSFGRKPILHYSENQERAILFDNEPKDSMPARRRRRSSRKSKRRVGSSRKLKGGHRINKGRISVRLSGFGLQKLPASQLIRFVPLKCIKTAAKRILGKSGGVGRVRKIRRGGRKKRGSRKRRSI